VLATTKPVLAQAGNTLKHRPDAPYRWREYGNQACLTQMIHFINRPLHVRDIVEDLAGNDEIEAGRLASPRLCEHIARCELGMRHSASRTVDGCSTYINPIHFRYDAPQVLRLVTLTTSDLQN